MHQPHPTHQVQIAQQAYRTRQTNIQMQPQGRPPQHPSSQQFPSQAMHLSPVLPRPGKKTRVFHSTPLTFPVATEVNPVEIPPNYSMDFAAFTELTTDLVANPVNVPAAAPHAVGIPVEGAQHGFGEPFVENAVAVVAIGDGSQVSGTQARSFIPVKPFDRSHPPSSPLSSGSGNVGLSSTLPHGHLFVKREAVGSQGFPGVSQHMMHNTYGHNNMQGGHANPGGTASTPSGYGSQLQQAPPSSHGGLPPPPLASGSHGGMENGSGGGSLMPPIHPGCGAGGVLISTGVSSKGVSDGQGPRGQGSHKQGPQSTLNQEMYQKRQAERAARNRESSRRAREKAKHRFRSLELDNFNLRETVRQLRMQNELLQGQYERISVIQQSCHVCRYKSSAVPPTPARSPTFPTGPLRS